MPEPITRYNIDEMLDKNKIQIQTMYGDWKNIRRNGKTKTWVRDANRIYIPYKFGSRNCYRITECDFDKNGVLKDHFRSVSLSAKRESGSAKGKSVASLVKSIGKETYKCLTKQS